MLGSSQRFLNLGGFGCVRLQETCVGESVAERSEERVHFHSGIALPPTWWLQGAML
jgi:hypothetical protein